MCRKKRDCLILREASIWPLVLTVCTERGERGGGRWREGKMADGLRGGCAGTTIKQPLTAHTTPEQLSDELRQGGGGLRMRSSRGEKRALSAELLVLRRGTLATRVITVEQAVGRCSSPRRRTDSQAAAVSCRPRCSDLLSITSCRASVQDQTSRCGHSGSQ